MTTGWKIKTHKGTRYVQGLHGIPDFYKNKGVHKPDQWYWREGSRKEDLDFMFETWFFESTSKDKEQND